MVSCESEGASQVVVDAPFEPVPASVSALLGKQLRPSF